MAGASVTNLALHRMARQYDMRVTTDAEGREGFHISPNVSFAYVPMPPDLEVIGPES